MTYTLKDPTVEAFQLMHVEANTLIGWLEGADCQWELRPSPRDSMACLLKVEGEIFHLAWNDYIVFEKRHLPKVMPKDEFEDMYEKAE